MTERIGIVVDSNADFPPGMAEALGLHVVPIHIVIDGKDYLHGVSIENDRVIAALREDREVHTSPPMPSEYADILEKLLERSDRLISLHVSKALSNCCTSVQSAVQLMFDDAAQRITSIDTRTCTAGQALIVIRVAEMLQRGLALDDVLHDLDFFRSNGSLYFTVDNLYWLKRAGRLNLFSSRMDGMLDIKPVIGMKKGQLIPLSKHRGHAAALDALTQLAHDDYRRHRGACEIWIAHAAAEDKRDQLLAQLALEIPVAVDGIQMAEVGPTIAAHVGPGCIALSVMPT
jgi:DegV family protein with EDD domain